MITAYEGRRINPLKPVQVYRNLHGKGYSIRQNGLVVAHATELTLTVCEFKVGKAGRERVLETKQKNVHAYVKGYIDTISQARDINTKATYNPYKAATFMCKMGEDTFPLYRARLAKIGPDGIFVYGPNG